MLRNISFYLSAIVSACLLWASPASAHFVWLATVEHEGQPHAVLYFSEGPAERDYHLPEKFIDAAIRARQPGEAARDLESDVVEQADLIGLWSTQPVTPPVMLETTCDYGIYQGMRLIYFGKHLAGVTIGGPAKFELAADRPLDAMPLLRRGKLSIGVLWERNPAEGLTVTLIDPAGKRTEATTDIGGVVSFERPESGLVGILVGQTDDTAGTLDGQEYSGTMYYLSLTFEYTRDEAPAATAEPAEAPAAEAPADDASAADAAEAPASGDAP